MKATGIVRRIDELGRVVIPKELRRSMRIKEGAPLEIYTHNGAVCFKPYEPVGAKNWAIAKTVIEALLACDYALVDIYDEVQAFRGDGSPLTGRAFIKVDGDVLGVLRYAEEDIEKEDLERAIAVVQSLFEEAE